MGKIIPSSVDNLAVPLRFLALGVDIIWQFLGNNLVLGRLHHTAKAEGTEVPIRLEVRVEKPHVVLGELFLVRLLNNFYKFRVLGHSNPSSHRLGLVQPHTSLFENMGSELLHVNQPLSRRLLVDLPLLLFLRRIICLVFRNRFQGISLGKVQCFDLGFLKLGLFL
jgi:hypothetical protein